LTQKVVYSDPTLAEFQFLDSKDWSVKPIKWPYVFGAKGAKGKKESLGQQVLPETNASFNNR
jgi:hypothetical protein